MTNVETLGDRKDLSIIQRFKRGEYVNIPLHEFCDLDKDLATFEPRHFQSPSGFECSVSGFDGTVNICWHPLGEIKQLLAS